MPGLGVHTTKALEYKLIDAIGYYDEAKAQMIADCGFPENVIFHDCIDKSSASSSYMLYIEAENTEMSAEMNEYAAVNALIERLSNNRRFMVMLGE